MSQDAHPLVTSEQEASSHADLYALTHDHIQDAPTSLWRSFRKIGPGLILAASIVGTGELINTTALGAKEGFVLLWLIVLSCVIKVFIQVELGRYAIAQGKTTLAALHTLPGPKLGTNWLCWLWLIMMLTTTGQLAAMEGLVGQTALMAIQGDRATLPNTWWASETFWASVTCFAAIALLLSGGYKRLERVTTAMIALVTFVTVLGALRVPMSFADIASGLSFSLPSSENGLLLAFSAFGITGVGASELFAYPYWCIEKGYARAAGPRSTDPAWALRARGWIRVMLLDAWFSMIVFTLATVAFYFMGAGVLHSKLASGAIDASDLAKAGMIRTLSLMYRETLGEWARPFFLIGAWAVLFKTLYVATAGNSRLMADFLMLGGFTRKNSPAVRNRVINCFCVILPLLALGTYWVFREPLKLVAVGGMAQALMLPLIAGATVYLRYRDADERVKPSSVTDALVWVAFVAITIVAGYSMFEFGKSLVSWLRA